MYSKKKGKYLTIAYQLITSVYRLKNIIYYWVTFHRYTTNIFYEKLGPYGNISDHYEFVPNQPCSTTLLYHA